MRNLLFNKRNQVKTNNNPTSSRFGSFLDGFTIIELVVTISIIGILAAIGTVSYIGWQKSITTAQLKSDLSGVATAMENAKTFGNAYPTSLPNTFTSAPDTTLTMFAGADGTNYCIDAASTKDPTLHFYIDQSSGRSGAQEGACASRGVNYTLIIAAGTGGTVNSGGSYASYSTPTITATPNANYVFSSWTGDTGCSGAVSHTITMDANKSCTANFTPSYTLTIVAGSNGTVNSGGTYASGSTPTITATPNSYYSFSSWTGDTGCSGVASHTITMDANKSCTANFTPTPITAPSAPTVTANTVGATTTWSWGAASCPGNTARYQYRYTYAPAGYDSGLIATASTSVGFTTSTEGQTYTVTVQAQCYNAVTSSAWSGSGSASYLRPITYYTLTIIAGANGTVNSGGSYASGSTPTITATPDSGYIFSSWSGDTGCSGTASHTITMNANKTCTANFTFPTVTIGTQTWMQYNINVGTRINAAQSQNQTNNGVTEKWCYSNLESNCDIYGGMYQWGEAMQFSVTGGAQGLCPTGFHVPTDAEFKTLEMYLGMTQAQADLTGYRGTDQGTQLKSGGTSGFNGLQGGSFYGQNQFQGSEQWGGYWTSTRSPTYIYGRNLESGTAQVYRHGGYSEIAGYSLRCIHN